MERALENEDLILNSRMLMSEHGKAMYVQRLSYLSFVCWLEGLGFVVVVCLACFERAHWGQTESS